jgi:hypothetical protein
MRKFSKRTIAVAGSAAVVMTAAGVAYAYYLTGVAGTGTGSATPAVNNALNLTFSASTISGLVPGAASVPTTVTFTNPNAYAVNFAGKTIAVSSVSGPAGCADNAVALLSGSVALPAGVLAKNASTTVVVPVSMADSTTVDQTACAGAPLTITYSAS